MTKAIVSLSPFLFPHILPLLVSLFFKKYEKANKQSEGLKKPLAVVVTSLLPTPSVSPCGICRQFLREFAALDTPIYMVADGYPRDQDVPKLLEGGEGYDDLIKKMTLEELLPMSFGPEHLVK
jgi:cytidine deaminase